MDTIELKNINLEFDNKQILSNFSLKINKGDKILISGKSGKGKSTILKILLGFSEYDSGEYLIDNHQIKGSDFNQVRKLFSYVNQDVTLRNDKVSEVLKQIAEFSNNSYNGEFDTDLAELLDFDLKLLEKNTTELSGGERQRLGIIIAVMLKREVYLLDEITSALDEGLKEKVVTLFANIDATVITVSHDINWMKNKKFIEVNW